MFRAGPRSAGCPAYNGREASGQRHCPSPAESASARAASYPISMLSRPGAIAALLLWVAACSMPHQPTEIRVSEESSDITGAFAADQEAALTNSDIAAAGDAASTLFEGNGAATESWENPLTGASGTAPRLLPPTVTGARSAAIFSQAMFVRRRNTGCKERPVWPAPEDGVCAACGGGRGRETRRVRGYLYARSTTPACNAFCVANLTLHPHIGRECRPLRWRKPGEFHHARPLRSLGGWTECGCGNDQERVSQAREEAASRRQ